MWSIYFTIFFMFSMSIILLYYNNTARVQQSDSDTKIFGVNMPLHLVGNVLGGICLTASLLFIAYIILHKKSQENDEGKAFGYKLPGSHLSDEKLHSSFKAEVIGNNSFAIFTLLMSGLVMYDISQYECSCSTTTKTKLTTMDNIAKIYSQITFIGTIILLVLSNRG